MISRITDIDIRFMKKYLQIAIVGLIFGYCWIAIMIYDVYYEYFIKGHLNYVVLFGGTLAILLIVHATLTIAIYYPELNNPNIGIDFMLRKFQNKKPTPNLESIKLENYSGEEHIVFTLRYGVRHRSVEILIPSRNARLLNGINGDKIRVETDKITITLKDNSDMILEGNDAKDIKFILWMKSNMKITRILAGYGL